MSRVNSMNRNIFVRRANAEDADQIFHLVRESMREYCRNSGIKGDLLDATQETVEDIRTAIFSVPVFAAVKPDGTIVGSVRLLTKSVSSFEIPELPAILSLQPGDSVSYFSRFAVRGDMQGLGIGSLLYHAAHAEAAGAHHAYILLHTSLSNRIMVSFYEKRGFLLLHQDSSRGYPRGLFGKKLPHRPDAT